jgi:spore coat polysaccharide biosynthesis protein SpsF
MHNVIILQARLSSSRLPRKVLAEISGKPIIAHIIDRLRAAQRAHEVCVAIPSDTVEDELAEVLAGLDVTVVRGSQHDVLGRFMQAAYQTHADLIVRATADNPLVSYEEIDRQLAILEEEPGVDYLITEGYPLGITPESFTLKTLEKLDYLARHAHMREHVTLYLRKNSGPFAIRRLEAPAEFKAPTRMLSVDMQQDLELFKQIYDRLYRPGRLVQLGDVFELLKGNPQIAALGRQLADAAAIA